MSKVSRQLKALREDRARCQRKLDEAFAAVVRDAWCSKLRAIDREIAELEQAP